MSSLPYGGIPPKPVFFDIETGPLSLEEIEAVAPPFNPAKHVKYGNLKDEAKRAAKAAEAEEDYIPGLQSKGGLDARYGRVLLVAAIIDDQEIFYEGEEHELISQLWGDLEAARRENPCLFINHNMKGFDLPFLIRRSWIHGIEIPTCVAPNGRYWPKEVIDTMDLWACTAYQHFIGLDQLGKLLGIGGKIGSGELFHELYAEDPEAARAYALRDVVLTKEIYNRIGGNQYVNWDQ